MSVSECLETFYSSLIVEELKKNGCNNDNKLIAAFDAIEEVYSSSALKSGDTYLDYNNPWNRCAYLCKFGIIHTGMVRKYFKKLVINASVKENLKSKSSIKICCLGGGAGTDVVGIFKVLSKYSDFYGKVVQVTVLDICGGWRNSFNEVMSRLVGGKVKNIPSDFVDAGKLVCKLIQVDLLQPLPSNVAQVLAEADVVTMVKFVSAVTGKPGALDALKIILEAVKLESVLLLIDNNNHKIVKSIKTIANSCAGLRMILGPMHSTFARVKSVTHNAMEKSDKKSTMQLRVSVVGWIKKANASEVCSAVAQKDSKIIDEEDCWATDSSSASDYDNAEAYETATQEKVEPFSDVSNKPKGDRVLINLFSPINQNETKIIKQEIPMTSAQTKHNEEQVAVNDKGTQALSVTTNNGKSTQTPVKPKQCSVAKMQNHADIKRVSIDQMIEMSVKKKNGIQNISPKSKKKVSQALSAKKINSPVSATKSVRLKKKKDIQKNTASKPKVTEDIWVMSAKVVKKKSVGKISKPESKKETQIVSVKPKYNKDVQTIIKTKNKNTQTIKTISDNKCSQTMSYNDLIQALVMNHTYEQAMETQLQHALSSCSDSSDLSLFLKDIDRLLSNLSKLTLSDASNNCCCEGRCNKTMVASTSIGSASDASFVLPSKLARELSEVISGISTSINIEQQQ